MSNGEILVVSDQVRAVAKNMETISAEIKVENGAVHDLFDGDEGNTYNGMFAVLASGESLGIHCKHLYSVTKVFLNKVAWEYDHADETAADFY